MSTAENQKGRFVFLYARARTLGICALWLLNAAYFAIRILHAAETIPAAQLKAMNDLKAKNLGTQFAAIETLKNYPSAATAQSLADAAVKEKDANFRLAALDQIAVIGRFAVVPTLAPLLRDKTVAVRQRTARVIGILGGPEAEDVLLPALQNETDASVRGALVQSLSLCGSEKSAGALNTAASDSDPSVRTNATYAVKRIHDETAKREKLAHETKKGTKRK